ncbi:MAG: DNA alkylation repair protein [Candidatus Riflebacteria bacterium]|nr:DNA alkylation repair protein [Candidatus Riflebacteria bacterium]
MKKIRNSFHNEILVEITQFVSKLPSKKGPPPGYLGNNHPFLGLAVPDRKKLAKGFLKNHPDLTFPQFRDLIDSLYSGESNEEKCFPGTLLEFSPKFRAQIDPCELEIWMTRVEGWQEVDSTCQSAFTHSELVNRWEAWQKTLDRLSKSENIHCRRASLVLLTKPVRKSIEPKLGDMSFIIIDRLVSEKNVLITKAISWLLRSLITNFRREVEEYLDKNGAILPAIASREVKRVLTYGKK